MIRFHRHGQRLGRNPTKLAAELATMRDFVQATNTNGAHVLSALDLNNEEMADGIVRQKLTLSAARLLRMLTLGQGKEFTRSPTGPTDDGMNEFEVRALVESLLELAVRAEIDGRTTISILVFDEEMIPPSR